MSKKSLLSSRAALSFLLPVLCLATLFSVPASAQRDLKNIPNPDPELERKSFIVADGFEVNLFAADPLLAKPIQMNFDERGRLWVASSEVYPHIKPGQKANDKLLILEDLNGDGKADKTSVFADGLLIPTGVLPGDGGAYVVNSTELLHFKDTDGDGKADQQKIILTGFGSEDTHHLLHTLRWGHDGALYMNQSIYIHSHIETPYGVVRLNGGGIWRFRPESLKLEIISKGLVNAWGHHFDRWGQSFATDGAGGEGINYIFPGSVFVTSPGAKRIMHGLNPGSPKHCSLEIVSGGHLPPEFQGNMITNDFRAHRVCRFVVTEDGSGYSSRQETELIKTKHVAFRPIDVKMGPDGAIYVADWYNPIIQHGEVDFRDPRRDHVHGRIWRITAKNRPLVKPASDPAKASNAELLDRLKASEEWIRLHAKLELKARGADVVLPDLKAWLAKLDPNDTNYEHHRLEGLWTYENIDTVNQELLSALLSSQDHHVRAAALRTVSHWHDRIRQAVRLAEVGVADVHPQVRLEAIRVLAALPSSESAGIALRVLDKPMDQNLDFALWQTMRDLQGYWLPAVNEGRLDFDGNVDHLTFALKAVDSPAVVKPLLQLIQQNKIASDRIEGALTLIAALGGPNELGEVFSMVLATDDKTSADRKAALLDSLAATSRLRKVRPAGDLGRVKTLLASDNSALRASAVRAAGVWKLAALRPQISAWAIGTTEADERLRGASIQALAELGGGQSVQALSKLAASESAFSIRQQAVVALASLNLKQASQSTVQLLNQLPEEANPAAMISAILGRKQGPAALAAALADKRLKADAAKLAIRTVRGSLVTSPELIQALQKAGRLEDSGWKLSSQLLAELVAETATRGNAARGEIVYRRRQLQCSKCHAIGGAGGRVGPDLVSVGASAQVDYLIESIVEPNKKIKENFHSLQILTDEGKVYSGILVRQSKTEMVLRDAEDRQIVLAIDSIDEKKDGRSLMPDGAADELTRDELVDLIRFLSELGKVGDFAISNTRYVRRFQTLLPTKEAAFRLRRTSFDTAATDDPTLTWEPAYSRVAGDMPLADLPTFISTIFGNRKTKSQTSFVRFQIEVTTPGKVNLAFNSPTGLTMWIDSKPTIIQKENVISLSKGIHTITLAINRVDRQASLQVELADVPASGAKAQLVSGK